MERPLSTPADPSSTPLPSAPPVSLRLHSVRGELVTHLLILGSVLLLLWLLEIIDQLFWREMLDFYGIEPRTATGLRHLLFAPFLHKGFPHLLANTAPFLVLGWFVLLRGVRTFLLVSLSAAVVSGLGVWLLGMPATIHIGLSGVLFGYLGFLLFRGYFERSLQAIVLAIVAGFLYGSMLWGVLPLQPNISWLGHLFGFVGGVFAARHLRLG
ncbi:MAG: rhomboid family intramembrane serine protease [Caldilineaceae bacterium]|nr:rhomboid family intramembrane serine protease [Caldilineaceae bacterium]